MIFRIATLGIAAAALASCAPNSIRPELTPLPAAAVGLGDTAGPVITDTWWTALGDPQLDRIMADALAGSPTLSQALARVRLADAAVTGRRAEGRPQVSFDGQEQRTRLSGKYIIPPPYGGTDRFVGSTLGQFSWNLDFWGHQAAIVDQARGSARAAAIDVAAARLALTANVAQAYIELVRAERLARIADDFVTSRQRSVSLVQSRIRNQLASNFDIRAAETLLTEAEQARLRAQGQREVVVHALAALAGRGADYYPTIQPANINLDAALPLPTTLPADLLGRRPDLIAGLARIDAAVAGRKVARTAYYPNINLLGNVGFQSIGLGSLLTGGAFTWGIGPSLHLPIFDGGKLRSDYQSATADLDIATADYNETVLRAVRDAADAISQVRTSSADAAEQARLVATLQNVVRLDERRTSSGLGSQLDILASGTRLLDAQQAAINIAADGILRRVQLIVALGGGFQPDTVATATATTPSPIEARR
ncbi:efflux transporter outer membrane subunit [Sphingosinicellaceae bacterium]|nr:efflux transporter outer membrane subunit [Sphingosinicellaceae bacterium]